MKSYHASGSVQLLSSVQLFGTPWIAAHQASLSITNSLNLLKLMSIKSVMPSNHLILCRPLLPPSIFPSIRVFPVVMYGCESWTVKKAEHQRIDAFELWCWRRLLRVSWTERRSNQSILKEISPDYSLEGLMLKLKLQILLPPDVKNWLTGKGPDAGKDWRQEKKGTTEDEMVGYHHQLDGHEFE